MIKYLVSTLIALTLFTTSAYAQSRPEDQSTDEAGLWYKMDKYEQALKNSGAVIDDPELNAYVRRVTCDITGQEACDKLRIYIIQEPIFNASMAPNGMMTVYSGLLLRSENEAQMACVLGHEYGHFAEKHSLEGWRRAKSTSQWMIGLQFAAAFAGLPPEMGQVINQVGSLLFYRYNRGQETEADTIGFNLTAKADYHADECANVWKNLISENENSSFKSKRRRGKWFNPYSTHPLPKDRINELEALAASYSSGQKTGRDNHIAAITPYLENWMKAELLARDFDSNIYLFEQLKARGFPPGMADYYVGEAYRLRKEEGDRARAVAMWEKAMTQEGVPASVHRALAEHYRKKDRKADALASYQTYLAQSPQAEDRELILAYINRLNKQLAN